MAVQDVAAQLEAEYCPPLDAALLQAILSDFDLADGGSLSNAREILDSLRASAVVEAESEFDATGTSRISPQSLSADGPSDGTDTDLTSLSNGVSRLSANDAEPERDESQLDALDAETKAMLLQELFPDINHYTVTHTLGKCNNGWQRAMDELLNISFLSDQQNPEATTVSHKGIDAFAENGTHKRARRRKRQGANGEGFSTQSRAHSEAPPPANKWQTADGDVDFIAKHAQLSTATVRATYTANGASLQKTIAKLLDDIMQSAKASATNQTIQAHAAELGDDFPTIKPAYLTALVQLTHPSTASAHELARALTAKPAGRDSGPIVPQYTPLNLSEDESTTYRAPSAGKISVIDGSAASQLAATHHDARRELSAQAQAAYRRSRSQRLMGGAAAYYSEVSREHAASALRYSSAAADSLVASQSTSSQLDLHGVTVADAIRIAEGKTRQWWANLGENKANGRIGAVARQTGYRIVVGLGRHSEGGKSKIGPAVYNSLTSSGWKVEKGEGYLTVRGKARA